MPDQLPRGSLKLATDALVATGAERAEAEKTARTALTAALSVIQRAAVKQAAQRILQLEALARGWICPACHGKPATSPSVRDGRTGWTCGCGHAWEPPRRDWGLRPDSLVRRLARGEPLPDLPPKEKEGERA